MTITKITVVTLSAITVAAAALIGVPALASSSQATGPTSAFRSSNAAPHASAAPSAGPSGATRSPRQNTGPVDSSSAKSTSPSPSASTLGRALTTIPSLDRRVVFAADVDGERRLLGVRSDGRVNLSDAGVSSRTRMVLVPAGNGQVRIERAQLDADLAPICLTASGQGDLLATRCQRHNTGQVFFLQTEAGGSLYGFTTQSGAGALADHDGLISMVPDAGTGFTLHDVGANPEPVD